MLAGGHPYDILPRRCLHIAGTLLLVWVLVGCANELVPPAAPENPVTVHLVDHGRHPSLILPGKHDEWIRYVHGEWRWYARNDTGIWRGIEALLWPTRAAIGRRELNHLPTPDEASPGIPEGFRRMYSFDVEQERMESLRDRLDDFFISAENAHFQPRFNLVFVPYPRRYWLRHHSPQVMVQWLRELGVEVRGPGLVSRWHLLREASREEQPIRAE